MTNDCPLSGMPSMGVAVKRSFAADTTGSIVRAIASTRSAAMTRLRCFLIRLSSFSGPPCICRGQYDEFMIPYFLCDCHRKQNTHMEISIFRQNSQRYAALFRFLALRLIQPAGLTAHGPDGIIESLINIFGGCPMKKLTLPRLASAVLGALFSLLPASCSPSGSSAARPG